MESLSDLDDCGTAFAPRNTDASEQTAPSKTCSDPMDTSTDTSTSTPTASPVKEEDQTQSGSLLSDLGSLVLPLPVRANGAPQGGVIATNTTFKKGNIDRPIGLASLPHLNLLAVSSSSETDSSVRLLSASDGSEVSRLRCPVALRSPSDLVSTPDGGLAVRDHGGIKLFDRELKFVKEVGKPWIGRCYGMAVTEEGYLVTLNTNGSSGPVRRPTSAAAARLHSSGPAFTSPGATDVLILDPESGRMVDKIGLEDVVTDKGKSKCRFIYCKGRKLYIADLGLDLIYILDLKRGSVRTFGGTGRALDQFSDPAGIAVDDAGNILVADSRNHEIKLFSKSRRFLGLVRTGRQLRRPSGILFDPAFNDLTVLNLWANNVIKFKLQTPKVRAAIGRPLTVPNAAWEKPKDIAVTPTEVVGKMLRDEVDKALTNASEGSLGGSHGSELPCRDALLAQAKQLLAQLSLQPFNDDACGVVDRLKELSLGTRRSLGGR